jgi:hypothetical protein
MSAKSTFPRAKAALDKKELMKSRSMKRIVLKKAIKEKLMSVIYPHGRAERSRNQLVGEKKAMQARIKDSYEIIATTLFMSLYYIDISAPKSSLLPKHR